MSVLSKQYHSLIISGRNTWDYWHLVPTTRPLVNPPEVDENFIKMAGRDGFVDLSELLTGRPTYGKRSGSWEFIAHPDFAQAEPWDVKYSDILYYLHNKSHIIILEDDPQYYYEGRLKVNQWKSDNSWSLVTIDYTLQPYKRALIDTGSDEWLWDPFDFETGVIEDYHELVVDGSLDVSVEGSAEPVVPTITAAITSGTMTVTFGGETYSLVSGDNVVSKIVLKDGVNPLTFAGNGTVSIKFRRGWL